MKIESTIKQRPLRAIVHGRDGVGKSTFASQAPGAVFVDVENGLVNIDARAVRVETWEALVSALVGLQSHDSCRTIVVDSLDLAEQLCWKHVCSASKHGSIEDFGYGKGYVAALAEWRIFLNALEGAKNVVLIAHSQRKSVKNPSGEDYESWVMKLNEKASGLLREWSDVVGFAELDVATIEQDGRTKAVSSGKRVMRCNPSPSYDSKTRFTLPDRIELDWQSFRTALVNGMKKAST